MYCVCDPHLCLDLPKNVNKNLNPSPDPVRLNNKSVARSMNPEKYESTVYFYILVFSYEYTFYVSVMNIYFILTKRVIRQITSIQNSIPRLD